MSINEREFMELCKTSQIADFMLKAMLCWLAHGEAFIEATTERLSNGDIEGMIKTVNNLSQASA